MNRHADCCGRTRWRFKGDDNNTPPPAETRPDVGIEMIEVVTTEAVEMPAKKKPEPASPVDQPLEASEKTVISWQLWAALGFLLLVLIVLMATRKKAK